MVMYILVSGGVMSGLGKGTVVSSIGFLLKRAYLDVTAIKIDPYLNIDAGTMSPSEHGECFVLKDGSEVDLDLGNYERFMNIELTKQNSITTGKIYQSVIEKERKGEYLGKTVQTIPHITDEIELWIKNVASGREVCLIELGGTVGDFESEIYLKSFERMKKKLKNDRFIHIHVTYVPWSSGSPKSKPTQHSLQILQNYSLFPDVLICRSPFSLIDQTSFKNKLRTFSMIENIISLHDVPNIYEIPFLLRDQKIMKFFQMGRYFSFPPEIDEKQSKLMNDCMLKLSQYPKLDAKQLNIAIFGKYLDHDNKYSNDCYFSLEKAIQHAACYLDIHAKIHFINTLSDLKLFDGIIIPGGFGNRGIQEKLKMIEYADNEKIPILGICLGCQLMVIHRTRKFEKDANSEEFDPESKHLVVRKLNKLENKLGGTMRIGEKKINIIPNTLASKIYSLSHKYQNDSSLEILLDDVNPSFSTSKEDIKNFFLKGRHITEEVIYKRHRHRFGIDKNLLKGLKISGISEEEDNCVEIVEDDSDHPFFVGVQYHPEYSSSPFQPEPLFIEFLKKGI